MIFLETIFEILDRKKTIQYWVLQMYSESY